MSKRKLSYAEVPGILTSPEDELAPLMVAARKLALGLLAKRRAEGALVFYDLNNGWITTEEGSIRKLKDHTETIGHIIIAELMVLTNAAVALYAIEHGIPMLFRNHEARDNANLDRAEILKFIDEAATSPVIDLEAFQHRAHKFFKKAEYGATLTGHAGLNLKAYTHFTSPIRRYADLVVHQQLRAHLKGQPLPHNEVGLAEVAAHLNDLAAKEREGASAHFKERDEQRALRQVETRRLDGLLPKQFERVVKVEVRSGESPSEALTEAWVRRLADATVPTICMTAVLMHGLEVDDGGLKRAPVADGWDVIKATTVGYLAEHTPDAVTVLTQATALGWSIASVEAESNGDARAPRFTGLARVTVDGERVDVTSIARTIKEARQRAAVTLLAELSMVPAPEFRDAAPAPTTAKQVALDPGKHPVSQLMEHAQASACPPPKFDFAMKGEAHLPVVTCTVTFQGRTVSAVSASKQEAKTAAARQLLGELSMA